jgi:heptose-I-phosphate ethanolaminephosphotransferase
VEEKMWLIQRASDAMASAVMRSKTHVAVLDPYRRQRWLTLAGLTLVCIYPFLLSGVLAVAKGSGGFDLSLRGNFYLKYAAMMALCTIYNAVFFLLLVIALAATPVRVIRLTGMIAMWVVLVLVTGITVVHFTLFGQLVGLASIYAILDSNMAEATEFSATFLRADAFIYAVLALLPILIIPGRLIRTLEAGMHRSYRTAFTAVGALVLLSYPGVRTEWIQENNSILFPVAAVTRAIEEKSMMRAQYARMQSDREIHATLADGSTDPVTHILVIGESTTRSHMSLYGYGRNTTPELLRLASEERIMVAKDACSSRGTTVQQLKELLTFATRENHDPLFAGPNLVQLMKSAGFKTYWISNQQQVGGKQTGFDNWPALFAQSADSRTFINKRGFWEGATVGRATTLDQDLFEPLEAALSDQSRKRFIIIHLLGTHAQYELRFPPDWPAFTGTSGADPRFLQRDPSPSKIAQYNNYDTAVHYNDSIISSIVRRLSNAGRGTLTYLSDHGESLGETSDFRGHIDGVAPQQIYQIPLLFHLSDSIKSELQESVVNFERNLNLPIQSDSLIHTLLDLYRIGFSMRVSEASLLSPTFKASARFCDTLSP